MLFRVDEFRKRKLYAKPVPNKRKPKTSVSVEHLCACKRMTATNFYGLTLDARNVAATWSGFL